MWGITAAVIVTSAIVKTEKCLSEKSQVCREFERIASPIPVQCGNTLLNELTALHR